MQEMKQLLFRVDEQELKTVEQYTGIVRGSHNYLCLMFDFGREWANYKKVVSVKDVEGNEYNDTITRNGVLLPKKVTGTSRLYITVYGRKGESTIQTNTVTIEQL